MYIKGIRTLLNLCKNVSILDFKYILDEFTVSFAIYAVCNVGGNLLYCLFSNSERSATYNRR
jgi:hypothetical protein